MSNEQKLREALQALADDYVLLLTNCFGAPHKKFAENSPVYKKAMKALATTAPAVNQQLTTEPLDERRAFESEMMRRKSWTVCDFQPHPRRGEYPHPDYLASYANTAWAGWQARAAMAQVSDINVVESLTNDTKDAARYRWLRDDTDSDWAICEWSHAPGDEGYYRDARAPHIVDAAIDAAMAQGVKG